MMLSWMWVVMVCSAGPMAVEKNEPEILPGRHLFWRKIGEGDRQLRDKLVICLNLLALPRGLEPLFSP